MQSRNQCEELHLNEVVKHGDFPSIFLTYLQSVGPMFLLVLCPDYSQRKRGDKATSAKSLYAKQMIKQTNKLARGSTAIYIEKNCAHKDDIPYVIFGVDSIWKFCREYQTRKIKNTARDKFKRATKTTACKEDKASANKTNKQTTILAGNK